MSKNKQNKPQVEVLPTAPSSDAGSETKTLGVGPGQKPSENWQPDAPAEHPVVESEAKVTGKASKKSAKAEVEAETPAQNGDQVVLASADDQTLECQIDNVKYIGKTILVPAAREQGIRQALEKAGYKLK